MHSNEIESYKKRLRLTRIQRELIVGKVLGDGHLETSDRGRTYRLKVEHSLKQKEYVDWLYTHFKEWVRTSPREIKNGTKYGFVTYSHPALRFYGQQFYGREGRKRIPPLIRKLLTKTALAIWYLDDGSWKSNRHKTFIIHSLGYAREDQERMGQVLRERFDIETALHRQWRAWGRYWRMYIPSASAEKFRQAIYSVVSQIPSMSYKLGNIMPKR